MNVLPSIGKSDFATFLPKLLFLLRTEVKLDQYWTQYGKRHYLDQIFSRMTDQDLVDHCDNLYQFAQEHPFPKKRTRTPAPILRAARDRQRAESAQVAKWRITAEIKDKATRGWYCWTDCLTLSPEHSWLATSQNAWNYYLDYTRKQIRKAVGAKSRTSTTNYCTYFACLEPHESGELHIHVVWTAKKIPEHWRDPMRGPRDYRREVHEAKQAWPWGWSWPRPIRFNRTDAWGQLGWYWPMAKNQRGPQKPAKPQHIASYIAKYLTKERTVSWRTRLSQNWGTKLIKEAFSKLSREQLHLLTGHPAVLRQLQKKHKLPPSSWLAKRLKLEWLYTEKPSAKQVLHHLRSKNLTPQWRHSTWKRKNSRTGSTGAPRHPSGLLDIYNRLDQVEQSLADKSRYIIKFMNLWEPIKHLALT